MSIFYRLFSVSSVCYSGFDRALITTIVLLFSLFISSSTLAQTATLRGFVRDESDGQPLQGVNVIVQAPGAEIQGAATDLDGLYTIARLPAGRYTLRATFIGYSTHADTIDLRAGQILTYNVALKPDATELGEVLVESESETAGAASVSAGLQTIRPTDIELIPAPDVSSDLAGYLVTLPGVVSTGDQGGQFFVRGGEPTQNLVLIDGMQLYQPFHLLGFYSAFPSDIIKSTDVYAGGFGPKYGGHTSSVIDISTRNGNKRRFAGSVSLAPFVSGAILEGPILRNRISFLGSWRQSMIEQGASKLIDQPLPYDFYDQFLKVHADLSENSQMAFSGIRTYDNGVIGSSVEDPDATDQVTWRNQAYGGRYLLLPASMPVSAEILMSFSKVENEFGPEDHPSRSSSSQQFKVAMNLTHYLGFADVNWGLFLGTSTLDSELGGQYQDLETEREFITEASAYLAPDFQLGNGLSFQPGIRIHSFPSKGVNFIEPRIRTTWDLGPHRFSAAWGFYHQEIIGLADRRDAGDIFTAWTASPVGDVPTAVHYIAGYNVGPADWLNFSIEGFYKQLSNLSISEWSAFPRFTTRLQPADGTVTGFDTRLEVKARPFYGFVSYGYADVMYEAQQSSIQYWFGELSKKFHPPHDRRHQVNAVGSLELAGFTLSLRWQFGSGLPFSEALGFDTYVHLDGPTDVLHTPGDLRVLYGEPYTGRLPAYHRLDVSLEREFELSPHISTTVQGSLINSYNRDNLFYLDLYTLRRVDQLPLIPAFGIKVSLK